ncbi:MAG: serine/threonine protein kinase, partial [Myxococcales bacterium]|nr:serine/threonine protein kinase [Myxococcales bacterium]
MAPDTANSAIDQTALSTDPPASASIVERRRLGLADTAASGHGTIVTRDTLRSDGPTPIPAPIPARIGRYMVIRPLGAGGMGVVVEAYDPELDRRVAIKLLKPDRGGGESQARLLREAQAMARLSHPNVVQVHDVGMVGDQVFVAMELIRGQTLAHWLSERPRGWREVVRQFIEAARGLQAAHAVGLVHRDFKPDNVLLADDGRVR